MARAQVSDTLTAACPQFAALKKTLPLTMSAGAAERAALTHALHCGTCRPLADQYRRTKAAQIARLAAEAHTNLCRDAIPVLVQVGKILENNGYHRYFLWDTRQADAGTPLEECRVSIVGALGIALYDDPRYATGPRVRAIEQLIVDRTTAPSLAAWADYPGNGQQQALDLIRDTTDALRASLQPTDTRNA